MKQKHSNGVPERLWSCHTAVVDGYAIEGHVPADLIQKMLSERPSIAGLAAPGMPNGAPGMEGPTRDRFGVEVYAVEPDLAMIERAKLRRRHTRASITLVVADARALASTTTAACIGRLQQRGPASRLRARVDVAGGSWTVHARSTHVDIRRGGLTFTRCSANSGHGMRVFRRDRSPYWCPATSCPASVRR